MSIRIIMQRISLEGVIRTLHGDTIHEHSHLGVGVKLAVFRYQRTLLIQQRAAVKEPSQTGNLIGGIFSKKEKQDTEKSKFATTVASLTEDVDASQFKDTDEVKTARNEGIASVVAAIFEIEGIQFKNKYNSQIDKNLISSRFQDFSTHYVEAVKKAVVFTDEDYSSSTIKESRQKGLSELLDTFFSETNRYIEIPSTTDFKETAANINAKIRDILENTDFSDDTEPIKTAFHEKLANAINNLNIELTADPIHLSISDNLFGEKSPNEAFAESVSNAVKDTDFSKTISDAFTIEVSATNEAEERSADLLGTISNQLTSLAEVLKEIKEAGPGFAYINTGSGAGDPGLD